MVLTNIDGVLVMSGVEFTRSGAALEGNGHYADGSGHVLQHIVLHIQVCD